MRPDTRSFSFTFLRGQQHEQEMSLSRPATRSQTTGRQVPMGKLIEDDEGMEEVMDGEREADNDIEIGGNEYQPMDKDKEPVQGCSTGGMNLRKFGSSFLKNISNTNKYASMDEPDSNNPKTKKSKEKTKAEALCEVDVKEVRLNDDTLSTISSKTTSLGRKINKTVQDVKSSLETFSQRFRRSTRKRYRMSAVESPMSPTRRILGRTPTKLYSPFGFDSPAQKTPKRLGTERTSTPRLAKTKRPVMEVYSPGNTFKNDLKDVHRGLNDLRLASRGITRRSVRF